MTDGSSDCVRRSASLSRALAVGKRLEDTSCRVRWVVLADRLQEHALARLLVAKSRSNPAAAGGNRRAIAGDAIEPFRWEVLVTVAVRQHEPTDASDARDDRSRAQRGTVRRRCRCRRSSRREDRVPRARPGSVGRRGTCRDIGVGAQDRDARRAATSARCTASRRVVPRRRSHSEPPTYTPWTNTTTGRPSPLGVIADGDAVDDDITIRVSRCRHRRPTPISTSGRAPDVSSPDIILPMRPVSQ